MTTITPTCGYYRCRRRLQRFPQPFSPILFFPWRPSPTLLSQPSFSIGISLLHKLCFSIMPPSLSIRHHSLFSLWLLFSLFRPVLSALAETLADSRMSRESTKAAKLPPRTAWHGHSRPHMAPRGFTAGHAPTCTGKLCQAPTHSDSSPEDLLCS